MQCLFQYRQLQHDLEEEVNAKRYTIHAWEDQRPDPSTPALSELDHDGAVHNTVSASDSEKDNAAIQLARSLRGIEITEVDGKLQFLVSFFGKEDRLDARNFSWARRIGIIAIFVIISLTVGGASSIDSMAMSKMASTFHVSLVAESLETGLYVAALGIGAFCSGPFSETVGRTPVYLSTLAIFSIFIMACGLAPNYGAQIVFRFLAGFFGATPISCVGGSMSDIFTPEERTFIFPFFAVAVFLGPIIGPVMGGWIAQSSVSWRWVNWTALLFGAVSLTSAVLVLPETYPPTLQGWKANLLNKMTGDTRYMPKAEVNAEKFSVRLRHSMIRPILMTATELILDIMIVYLTVIYIILFTSLDSYDFIFAQTYGVSSGIEGTIFLGMAVGLLFALPLVPLDRSINAKRMVKIRAAGGTRHPPEDRLFFAMWGAPCIPISLFWMGWTAYDSINIWSPICASVLFGFGMLTVFISCYQYIIDSYEMYAASALASVSLIRYVASGGMIIASVPFYQNMGVHYPLTILGSIAAACVPIPYVFFVYGRIFRKHSKHAPTD